MKPPKLIQIIKIFPFIWPFCHINLDEFLYTQASEVSMTSPSFQKMAKITIQVPLFRVETNLETIYDANTCQPTTKKAKKVSPMICNLVQKYSRENSNLLL